MVRKFLKFFLTLSLASAIIETSNKPLPPLTQMPNFTVTLNSSNQVTSLSAATRDDYIQLVNDYANGGDYLDQYDLDTLAEALLDASEPWLSFDECEDLYCSLGLA